MADIDQNLSGVKTDVALIKKDIKQIERFFSKFDYVVEMSAERDKNLAVQHEILNSLAAKMEVMDAKIDDNKVDGLKALAVVHDRLEQYRTSTKDDHQRLADSSALNRKERNQEIMDALAALNKHMDTRLAATEDKVTSLDRWKWYLMGMAAVAIFIISRLEYFH